MSAQIVKFPGDAERGRLLVELRAAYAGERNDALCPDDPLDIIREAVGDAPEHVIAVLARELGPEAFAAEKAAREAAVESLTRAEQGDVLKMMLFRIWEAPKPRLSVGCLLLSLGIKPLGVASGRELARQQAVSPEHVSAMVDEWQGKLGLPKTEFQKSEAAVQAARLHNRNSQKTKAA